MARIRKPRHKDQGLDINIGLLRKLAKDEKTPAWIKLLAIDRLLVIDKTCEIPLTASLPIARPIRSTKEVEVPEEDVNPPVAEGDGKELLDEFNRRFYNRGRDGNTSTGSAANSVAKS